MKEIHILSLPFLHEALLENQPHQYLVALQGQISTGNLKE